MRWADGKRSFGGVAAMDTMEDLPQAVQAAAGEMSMAPAAQAPAAVPQPEHPSSDRAAAAVAPSVEEPAVAVAATKPRPANLRTSWGGSRRTQVATKTAGAGREHRVQQGGTGRSAKRAGPPAAPAPKRKEMPKKANSASRLTQPKTPEMMKRGRRSSVKRAKTSEELELEKIKAMRKSFAKKRKLSANSFKKVRSCTNRRGTTSYSGKLPACGQYQNLCVSLLATHRPPPSVLLSTTSYCSPDVPADEVQHRVRSSSLNQAAD